MHISVMECPESMLGSLAPVYCSDSAERPYPRIMSGDAMVDGVELSEQVLEELRRLGMPLWSYNRGELIDAKNACHFDGQLVDDENGLNFRDKLTLTDREKRSHHSFWADKECARKAVKHAANAEDNDDMCVDHGWFQ